MIPMLLWLGGIVCLGLWLAGLPGVRAGRPKLALYSSTGGVIIGLICSVGAMSLPRYSSFWFGSMGQGDGFGLIGLSVFGACLALASFIALLATAAVGAVRAKKTDKDKEVS